MSESSKPGEERATRMVILRVMRDLLDAARALRKDEWRATIDWGPRDEREAINRRVDRTARRAASILARDQREKRRPK